MTRKSKPPIAIYSALADATRCRIVEILLAGPIPVHTLADAFSISRPAISRHLRVLKTAGLVAEVKKGRENLYALRSARLNTAIAWISTIVAPSKADDEQSEAAALLPVAGVNTAAALPETVALSAPPAPAVAAAPEPAAVVEPDSVPAAFPAVQRYKADKVEKVQRPLKTEPAIDQMGFDF